MTALSDASLVVCLSYIANERIPLLTPEEAGRAAADKALEETGAEQIVADAARRRQTQLENLEEKEHTK